MKNIKKIIVSAASLVLLSILMGMSCLGGEVFAAEVTTRAGIMATASEDVFWFKMAAPNPLNGEYLEIREGGEVDLRWWDDYSVKENTRMDLIAPGKRGASVSIGNDDVNWTTSDDSIIELYEKDGLTLWNVKKPGEVTITAEIKEDVFPGLSRTLQDGFTGGSITFNVIDSQAVSDFEISTNAKASYTAGEYVNIEATAVNNTTEDKEVLLITALYDGNKMLVHSGSGNKVEAGKSIKLSSGFLLPENSAGYKIKVFVWDKWYDPATSIGGNALSDVIEIEVK